MVRTVGIALDAITMIAFWISEFEHEGLERGIDNVSDGLFGGGFKAVL